MVADQTLFDLEKSHIRLTPKMTPLDLENLHKERDYNIEQFIAQLKRHEGLRLKPYQCTENKTTLGFGRNIEDRGISEEEALFMLMNDMKVVEEDIGTIFTTEERERMGDIRIAVVGNMLYNIGRGRFKGFKKAIAAMKTGDFDEAAAQMKDSRWYQQVPNRAEELCQQMATGRWQH